MTHEIINIKEEVTSYLKNEYFQSDEFKQLLKEKVYEEVERILKEKDLVR